MKWNEKIKDWKNGIIQTYPKNLKKRFFFETYVCDKNMENNYEELFIENNSLQSLEQDTSSFKEHLEKSKNKYVTTFDNLSKDSRLIIPIPKKDKNYTTIKDFIDNASETQQKYFWKKVSTEIQKILKKYDKIYVSTHGLGVPYFHLRIDSIPKYYVTKKFIK
jgi:hypothetical protein